MTQIPGAWIETLKDPCAYTRHQLEVACMVASGLNRGRLILTEPPRRGTQHP